jgi:hypothetical protein
MYHPSSTPAKTRRPTASKKATPIATQERKVIEKTGLGTGDSGLVEGLSWFDVHDLSLEFRVPSSESRPI